MRINYPHYCRVLESRLPNSDKLRINYKLLGQVLEAKHNRLNHDKKKQERIN